MSAISKHLEIRPLLDQIFQQVSKIRKKSGIRVIDIYQWRGVTPQSQMSIHKGNPKLSTLFAIAEALNCDLVVRFKQRSGESERGNKTAHIGSGRLAKVRTAGKAESSRGKTKPGATKAAKPKVLCGTKRKNARTKVCSVSKVTSRTKQGAARTTSKSVRR